MCHALGLALATAQAMLDLVIQQPEFTLLQDQCFLLHQCQRRRVSVIEAGSGQQFALVETSFRINLVLVLDEVI